MSDSALIELYVWLYTEYVYLLRCYYLNFDYANYWVYNFVAVIQYYRLIFLNYIFGIYEKHS